VTGASPAPPAGPRPLSGRVVLVFMAGICAVAALLFNEVALGWLDLRPEPPATDPAPAIRAHQLVLLVAALALGGLARLAPRGRATGRSSAGLRLAFVAAATLLPLALLEYGLRPIADLNRKPTTIFVRDDVLGWRLRPGVEDEWAGLRIRVNDRGLRGPEVPWERERGVPRILYLGDSVTFGFGLPEAEQSYPYAAGRALESALGRRVETVNAGVGGYSPWQERLWLRDEGLRYSPDLVVLGFVLNDVTEKLNLRRFGGSGIGLQLAMSRHSTLDSLRDRSATVQVASGLGARLRYGRDTRRGAEEAQGLLVESLVHDADDPAVDAAWELTLGSLDGIIGLCRAHGIPLAVVVFPFRFQLDDPAATSAPQRRLLAHLAKRSVPSLDLLPLLARSDPAQDLLPDGNHLSAAGSERVGRHLAGFLLSMPQLRPLWRAPAISSRRTP